MVFGELFTTVRIILRNSESIFIISDYRKIYLNTFNVTYLDNPDIINFKHFLFFDFDNFPGNNENSVFNYYSKKEIKKRFIEIYEKTII